MTHHNSFATRMKSYMSSISSRCDFSPGVIRRMSSGAAVIDAHQQHLKNKNVPSSKQYSHYSYAHPSYRSLIGIHQSWSINQRNLAHNAINNCNIERHMSSDIRRGTDLLADSLAHGPRRKIILESYAPSGFDVKGCVQVGEHPDEGSDIPGGDKIVHMNGSIIVFPDACFLLNIKTPEEVTLESLSVVKLYRPIVEYLFIGCERPVPLLEMGKIKQEFRKADVVVEQMDIMNCIGTFNILNGEDRRVACVLVIDAGDAND